MTTFKQSELRQAEREGRAWDESGTASPYDFESCSCSRGGNAQFCECQGERHDRAQQRAESGYAQ